MTTPARTPETTQRFLGASVADVDLVDGTPFPDDHVSPQVGLPEYLRHHHLRGGGDA